MKVLKLYFLWPAQKWGLKEKEQPCPRLFKQKGGQEWMLFLQVKTERCIERSSAWLVEQGGVRVEKACPLYLTLLVGSIGSQRF